MAVWGLVRDALSIVVMVVVGFSVFAMVVVGYAIIHEVSVGVSVGVSVMGAVPR